MEWNELDGDWTRVSPLLKAKWSSLTDDDLLFVDRNKAGLLVKIQQRTGLARDTVERQLDAMVASLPAPVVAAAIPAAAIPAAAHPIAPRPVVPAPAAAAPHGH